MKRNNSYYALFFLWIVWTLSSCVTQSSLQVTDLVAPEEEVIHAQEQTAHTEIAPIETPIDPNHVAILRIWHSFEPEKLQNVGKPENDLMPLPNTPKFPYQDTLLKASMQHPQILIYNGANLSQRQINMFENLHLEAKKTNGTLFTLDFNAIKNELSHVAILPQITTKQDKADYVDILRLIILYDMDKVLEKLKEKYRYTHIFRYMLHADFDRCIEDQVQRICLSTMTSYKGLRLPVTIYGSNMPYSSSQCFPVTIENNFILCTASKSPCIEDTISYYTASKGTPNQDLFYCMCKVFTEPITITDPITTKDEGRNDDPLRITRKIRNGYGISLQLNKNITHKKFMELFSPSLSFGIIVEALEGIKDRSWTQDINDEIICSQQNIR